MKTTGKCGHKICTKSGKCPTGRKIIRKNVEILGTFPTRNRRASGPGSLAKSWMPAGERQAGAATPVNSQENTWPVKCILKFIAPHTWKSCRAPRELLRSSSIIPGVIRAHGPALEALQWASRALRCHPMLSSGSLGKYPYLPRTAPGLAGVGMR